MVQAKDLDVKGHLRWDNTLNGPDEDASPGQDTTFDGIWDAYSMLEYIEPIDKRDRIVERRDIPFNGHVDSKDQPSVFSFAAVGPQELMGLDYRPASVCGNSLHACASLGEQGLPANAKTFRSPIYEQILALRKLSRLRPMRVAGPDPPLSGSVITILQY